MQYFLLIQNDYTALLDACQQGNEQIVKLLIQAGASLNTQQPKVCCVYCKKFKVISQQACYYNLEKGQFKLMVCVYNYHSCRVQIL